MKAFDPATHCGAMTNARFNGATPCRQAKGMRTDHPGAGNCWLHGGRSPNGERHAQREAAAQALAKLGVPVGTGDPFTLLAKAVSHAEGYLEATAQLAREATESVEADPKVAEELEPQPHGGALQRKHRHDGSALGIEVAAEIYEQAIRTAARTGKAAVDADVADRLAALDERAGSLLLRFVRELLAKVVPAAKRPALEAWASTRLAELAAEYEHPVAVH